MNVVMADIMDGVDKKVGIIFTLSMHIKNKLARLKGFAPQIGDS